MDPSSSSASAQVTLPPPLPGTDAPQDAYEAATRSLSFPLASQAQIIRSHQRDSAQVWRLTELASDLIRSVTGIRWLAHHQAVVDLLVRTVYLVLTLGRGGQTLGEEYTDILPYAARRRNLPTRRRRLLTILLLLLPAVLTNPIFIQRLRSPDGTSGRWQGARSRLAAFLESPLARILPELHLVAFMFRGRFFEIARRITGLSYLSTLPPRPPEQQHPSYEPLGLLMLIPLATRLLSYRDRGSLGSASASREGQAVAFDGPLLPISPPMTPPASNEQTMLLTRPQSYDTPNTYLTPDAQAISERQCTLCLEPRGTGEGSGGTVAVTECGHVFCWGCLGGLDKPECPLCRQALRMERLVAAYNL